MSTYHEAGVDLQTADQVVDAIADTVMATWGDNVVGSFGGFAGGFRIPPGYSDPVLMMSTDGIGTKLDLARRTGRLDGVGYDLVAMVIDDLAAAGAQPLALTDYIAVGRIDPDEVATIVASIAAACSSAGVALIGGETAEHPGTMPPDALDVAAAAVGVAEGSAMLDPTTIIPGDSVIGVASPNLRSNGFSLVRAIVGDPDEGTLVGDTPLSDVLTAPSVIYSPAAVAVRAQVKAFAHVTGGGVPGNVTRVLPPVVDALIHGDSWPTPPVFDFLQERGEVALDEMRRVFNMGIGFVAICDPTTAEGVRSGFSEHGHATYTIGSIVAGSGLVLYEDSTGGESRPKP